MEKLLGTNTKLDKSFGKAAKYLVKGLTLAPHSLSGHEVCEWATPACKASCVLWFAGRRVMEPMREKALRITRLLFENKEEFIKSLHSEIIAHTKSAHRQGLIPAIRLNMASDLDWSEVISQHPNVVFYDYTKSLDRMQQYLNGELPKNYSLVFSASENSHETELANILNQGGNIAQVFNIRYVNKNNQDELPEQIKYAGVEYQVIDADKHDLRIPDIDGSGVVCGLRLKGMNKTKDIARKKGFAA